MSVSKTTVICSLIFLASCQTSSTKAPEQPVPLAANVHRDRASAEAQGPKEAIATQGIASTQAAQSMYDQGGNIIDAAVAASFTLAVERPQSTGVSGGGFLLFYEAKTQKTYAVDFRERAPLKARANMYIDKKKHVDSLKSRDGVLAGAVPGLVAGLLELHEKFGKLSRAQVLTPAIELAEKGFPVYSELQEAVTDRADVLRKDPEARKLFLTPEGKSWPIGYVLVQKELGKVLREVADKGRAGFYKGSVADAILKYSQKHGGILQKKDFDDYRVIWREPLKGSYHGYDIMTMPPPSSGGVHVLEVLNILEPEPLAKDGVLSAPAIHWAASALQSAFADRAKYLGDPDFVKVPVEGLISKDYASSRRAEIPNDRARSANDVSAGKPFAYEVHESTDTTHFSIMDQEGNAVSSTQTINGWMGAGVVIPGTGIVLNNEMDDFSAQPGAVNMFGAVGSEANAIAPKKTPLSSMSPTLIFKDGKTLMAVGAPGGTRIISCTAQAILNYLEFHRSLYESVAMVRYHHQWQPDELDIEPPGPALPVLQTLQKMGYNVQIKPIGCKVMAVAREGYFFHAVADPRDIGTSSAK